MQQLCLASRNDRTWLCARSLAYNLIVGTLDTLGALVEAPDTDSDKTGTIIFVSYEHRPHGCAVLRVKAHYACHV
jgi:hypothetical protein